MADWDTTPTEITIRKGGPAPGCVAVGIFLIGVLVLAFGAAVYLDKIEISLEDTLPLLVFTGVFGLFWWFAIPGSRRNSPQTTVVIDTFNRVVRYHDDTGRSLRAREDSADHRTPGTGRRRVKPDGSEIVIPFADLESFVLHETVVENTSTTSIHSKKTGGTRKTYTYYYRVYLLKKDGSILWLDTFSDKKTAAEHLRMLLKRVDISCIDEANAGLARSTGNPYTDTAARSIPSAFSPSVALSEMNDHRQKITIRTTRHGAGGFLSAVFLIGLFIGCPLWFYVTNRPAVPDWFLIIPSVPALGLIIGAFVLGRRYIIICGRDELEITVRFRFPLFQLFFGRCIRIPVQSLASVRVNRYEGQEFHLELIVHKDTELPKLTGLSFNTGAIRMLPRACLPDELKHIGLWAVHPGGRRGKGPQIADLFAVEALIQSRYGLDLGKT